MAFFNQAINILQTLVVAIGAGLAVWGVINLLEGWKRQPRCKVPGDQTADGRRRCRSDWHPAGTVTVRIVQLREAGGR